MDEQPCVYILASQRHGTLYTGVTSNLLVRLHQHRTGSIKRFTDRYAIHHLVCFEVHDTMDAVITGEKRLKKWNRDSKLRLIEERNPEWVDLGRGFGFEPVAAQARA